MLEYCGSGDEAANCLQFILRPRVVIEPQRIYSMIRHILFPLAVLFSACSGMNSTVVDRRDFGVDSCFPGLNEIQIAEQRARRYWQKNAARLGPEPRYLAVQTSCIPGTQLNAEFSAKMDRSETTGSFFAQSGIEDHPGVVYGVMLFDTETDRIIGRKGYVFVDLPPREEVVRIGDQMVRYIGVGG